MAIITSSENATVSSFNQVIDASSHAGDLILPFQGDLGGADFQRLGQDLLIEFPNGETVLLTGFFLNGSIENLVAGEGFGIPFHIIKILAGPQTPAQFAQAVPGQGAEPVGVVETIEGAVFVVRADGTRVALSDGDPIFQGDTLETGEDGVLGVTFIDDSTLSLDQASRIVVDEMIFDPGTQEGNGVLFALQGAMSFVSGGIAATNPDAMLINTPVATIGIRGTSVVIYVEPPQNPGEEPKLSIALVPEFTPDGEEFVGEAFIINNEGSQTLAQAFSGLNVTAGQPPSPPVVVSLNEIGRVFGDALLANPNANAIPPAVRDAVEKIVEQVEAEEARLEAETEAQQAEEVAETTRLAALAAAEEAAEAEAEAEALAAELQNEELTEEELAALEAALLEAEALAEALVGEAGALEAQAEEAEVALEEAELTLNEATQTLAEATAEAQQAVTAYAESVDNPDLTSDSNLTGQNTSSSDNANDNTDDTGESNEESTDTSDTGDGTDAGDLDGDTAVETNEVEEEVEDVFEIVTDTEDTFDNELDGLDDTVETDTEETDTSSDDTEDDSGSSNGPLVTQNALSSSGSYQITLDDLAHNPPSPILNNYTFEAWIKVSTDSDGGTLNILSVADVGGAHVTFSAFGSDDPTKYGLSFKTRDPSANQVVVQALSDSGLTKGQWHHVAAVYNGSQHLYIDGVNVETAMGGYAIDTDANDSGDEHDLLIGVNQSESGNSINYLAEVRIWDTDKSSDITDEDYRTSQLDLSDTTGLVAYLSFDTSDFSSSQALLKQADGTSLNPSISGSQGINYSWTSSGPSLSNSSSDPIIIDLDGDGIELTNLQADVYFDTDANGILDNTGWFGPDDGLLVVDINQDALINDMSEVISHYFNYQDRNEQGFISSKDVLALYDDNQDNKIDAEDEIFNVLQIWQDKNQNGQTDIGELLGAEEHGINVIFLDGNELNTVKQGNDVKFEGSVAFEDGSTKNWNEVWFETGEEKEAYSSTAFSEGNDIIVAES